MLKEMITCLCLCTEEFKACSFSPQDCDMFISKYSNQKNPHCVSLYRLTGSENDAAHRTKEFWATILDSAGNGIDEKQIKDKQDQWMKDISVYACLRFACLRFAVLADQSCLWNSGLCEEFRRDIFSSATNWYKQTMKEFKVEINQVSPSSFSSGRDLSALTCSVWCAC